MASEQHQAKRLAVFTTRQVKERTIWTRIGTAFVNKDQSLNVVLEALPMGGRLHIREDKAKADAEAPEAAEAQVAA